jgi:hypothetical protein
MNQLKEFAFVRGSGPFARVEIAKASYYGEPSEFSEIPEAPVSRSPSVAVWAIVAAALFFGSMAAAIALG